MKFSTLASQVNVAEWKKSTCGSSKTQTGWAVSGRPAFGPDLLSLQSWPCSTHAP